MKIILEKDDYAVVESEKTAGLLYGTVKGKIVKLLYGIDKVNEWFVVVTAKRDPNSGQLSIGI